MKIRHRLFALIIALPIMCSGEDLYNKQIFTYKGVDYATKFPSEFPDSPSWNPGDGEPPLSIAQALKLANIEFEKEFKKLGNFALEGISLSRQALAPTNHWVYLITYMQDLDDAEPIQLPDGVIQRTPTMLPYYVSFDGKVYPPVKK